ncbi:hypothetical protein [Methylobacterium ajmalii]|uniref:hypothetical protein n=1 Tax=Methylobacterium ajmalii TaxID=2738439 RepID=UPI002F34F312
MKRHPITIREIPSLARLAFMKRRALRRGTILRLLLSEERDLRRSCTGMLSPYDVAAATPIINRVDQIVLRTRDGGRRLLKDRFNAGL